MQRVYLLVAIMLASALIVSWHDFFVRSRQPVYRPVPRHTHQKPAPWVRVTHNFAVPVLMYHRIDELNKRELRNKLLRDLTVSPEIFSQQMKYLADNGFSIISTGEIEKAVRTNAPLPAKAAAITFDDGYIGTFTNAYPVLKKYKAPATVFVVTNTIGTPGHISWKQLRAMRKEGITCASHTLDHADLTLLTKPQVETELRNSRRILQNRLGMSITSLAYPSGECNSRVAACLAASGYLAGWKKSGGPVRPSDSPYFLPRIRVSGLAGMEQFKAAAQSRR